MYDNDGVLIDPSQFIIGSDTYGKQSHELRVQFAGGKPLAPDAGVFTQRRRTHHQAYRVAGLTDDFTVPGNLDTLWLTEQERTDRDDAVFGEFTFDITEKLSGDRRACASSRRTIHSRVSSGYGAGFSSGTGEADCFDPERSSAARLA